MNCWEFMKCGREKGGEKAGELGVCPAYPDHGHHCAYIVGTMCGGKTQGTFVAKLNNCIKCDFLKSDHFDHSYNKEHHQYNCKKTRK